MLNKSSSYLYTLGNDRKKGKNSSANTYLLRVNNSNIRKRREIYSKLTIMSQRRSTVFLLTLNVFHTFLLIFLVFLLLAWMCARSHSINLQTLKLLTGASTNRCTKILVKWELIKRGCEPKQSFLKSFFPCSLLCLIVFNV